MNFPSKFIQLGALPGSSLLLWKQHTAQNRWETGPLAPSWGRSLLDRGVCPRRSLRLLTPRLPHPCVTSGNIRPMGVRLTGRRCRRPLPKGKWAGAEAMARVWSLRPQPPPPPATWEQLRPQPERGPESRLEWRRRVWVAESRPYRNTSNSAGALQVGWAAVTPPHRAPRPRQQGWGLPRRGTGSSQAESSRLGSGSSLASDSLKTRDGGRRTVISDSGIFSVRVVVAGSPLLLPSGERPARSHRLALHLPVCSHSRTKFLVFLFIGNPAPEVQNTYLCVLSSSWSTFRNIVCLPGFRISYSWLDFLSWETKVAPLPNTLLSNWHSMHRPLPIWITSSLAVSMWLAPFIWVPVSSGVQSPAPSVSGQSHPWVGVTRGLWPRLPHPGRQLQSRERIGCRVRTWQLRSGCSTYPTQEDEKAQRAQCIDRLGWGQP